MNIYDVSQQAGVSIATVSRVLNGSPNVSGKTKEKVLRTMDEMGYTPNVFARGLGLNTMKTIGVLCSDSSDPYLASAIYFLERELRSNGYGSILCCTGYSLENKKKCLSLLLSKRVDALILAGSKFVELKSKDNAYLLQAAGEIPLMLVNGYLEGDHIYSTVCDDRSAVCEAVTKLINSECRRVLYVYTSNSYSGANKLQGYLDALACAGIPRDDALIRQCPKDITAARDLLLTLHRQGLEFQAVMVSDDALAVGAVKYAHALDIPVPDGLSVVGYNDSILSRCTDPEITSVDTKVEALCITTVSTLMGVFSGSNVPGKTTIAADLICRETTRF